MRRLIERFRYQPELWRPTQAKDGFDHPTPSEPEASPQSESIPQILERFVYRLEVWRREHGEEWLAPKIASAQLEALLKAKSIPKLLVCSFVFYFHIILILALSSYWIVDRIPTARGTVLFVLISLVCVWTVLLVVSTSVLYKARKRQQVDTRSPTNRWS